MLPVYAIELDEAAQSLFTTQPCRLGIAQLKQANLFCGPNNSGKSRLLRHLFLRAARPSGRMYRLHDWPGSNQQDARISARTLIQEVGQVQPQLLKPEAIPGISNARVTEELIRMALHDESLPQDLKNIFSSKSLLKYIETFRNRSAESTGRGGQAAGTCFYIPSIRSARSFGNEKILSDYVKSKYFSTDNISDSSICTGRELYATVRARRLGPPAHRRSVDRFEEFLSKWFFDQLQVSLVPRQDDDELHIRIGAERERPIHQLGDGLQHLLTIFSPAFLSTEDSVSLFIEEPELYLHAGIQRRFLEAIIELDTVNPGKRHQAFITTHSNHLLDMSLDTRAKSKSFK